VIFSVLYLKYDARGGYMEKDKKANNNFFANKEFVLNALPLIIGFLGVLVGFIKNSVAFAIIILFILLLTLLNILAIYYYGKREKHISSEIEKLKQDIAVKEVCLDKYKNINKVMNHIVATFDHMTEQFAKKANIISHDIQTSGKVKEREWNVPLLCEEICISCCDMIKKEAKTEKDVGVSFISSYINNNNIPVLKMIADSSQVKPNVYDIEEPLESCIYYYATLIREKNPDITAVADKDKLYHLFRRKKDTTDLTKYSQYIAIPVICYEKKVIGILQVVIRNGLKIRETDLELRELAENYIGPFVRLILLTNKLEKGLFAIPNDVIKKESE